jgi:multiple sugar transport system substrate-binding protein
MDNKKFSRRKFLRAAAGTSAALIASGTWMSSIRAQDPTATPTPTPTNTPFSLPQGAGGKLTIIHKTEYFEDIQKMFREEVIKFVTEQGAEIDISTANPALFGDFTSKMQAAVQAGNPPDIAYHVLSIPQLQALDIVEDVSDIVEEAIKLYGTTVPLNAERTAKIDGKWYAVPYISTTGAWFARIDLYNAAGIDALSLDTWEKRREAALAVSNPDKKVWGWGLTINRSGDGHGLIMSVIHSFGGSITDETGKKVVFNSPETVGAAKWLQETYTSPKYKLMLPPGIESWTDTSNNELYLAGTIALTFNQLSVYAAAKANKNPVYSNTAVLRGPKTLKGERLETGENGWFTIFKGAKNRDLAKKLILHMLDPRQFTPMVRRGAGLFLPAYRNLWTKDFVAADPNFKVLEEIQFNQVPYYGISHPALPNALADSVIVAAIPSQLIANIITGKMSDEEAVADAHNQIVQIYEEAGIPQN